MIAIQKPLTSIIFYAKYTPKNSNLENVSLAYTYGVNIFLDIYSSNWGFFLADPSSSKVPTIQVVTTPMSQALHLARSHVSPLPSECHGKFLNEGLMNWVETKKTTTGIGKNYPHGIHEVPMFGGYLYIYCKCVGKCFRKVAGHIWGGGSQDCWSTWNGRIKTSSLRISDWTLQKRGGWLCLYSRLHL